MSGERVRQARELAGLTQMELAMAAGIAQSAIAQIEAGLFAPNEQVLQAIAIQTGFDVQYLRKDTPPAEFPMGSALYRTLAKVSAKDKEKAHRMAQFMFEMVLAMRPRLKSIPVMISKLSEPPEVAAQITRSSLGFSPESPVPDLINALERAGVLVLDLPLAVEGLDGFASWVGPNSETPVICLLGGKHGYRRRFTTGEEVGHLVQHFPLRCGVPQADDEARRFAGELLLPEEMMRRQVLSPVTLTSLGPVRNKMKVSYAFLIKRIADLGIIKPNQYRYLMMQMSSRGWRTVEPGDSTVTQEKALLFSRMVEAIYGNPPDIARLRRDVGAPVGLLRALIGTAPSTDPDTGAGRIVAFQKRAS